MIPKPLAMLPPLPRPTDVTPRMWRTFLSAFAHGMRFWSSEDGDSGEVVIARLPDALDVLRREFDERDWSSTDLRPAYVDRVWLGADYFDGPWYPGKVRRGRGWQLSDEPTPFAVFVYDPHAPLPAAPPSAGETQP